MLNSRHGRSTRHSIADERWEISCGATAQCRKKKDKKKSLGRSGQSVRENFAGALIASPAQGFSPAGKGLCITKLLDIVREATLQTAGPCGTPRSPASACCSLGL